MKRVLPVFSLLIIVIIVFFPVLGNDFLYLWDDQWMVFNDYTTGGWGWDNLYRIFTHKYHGQYAPFGELNYLILYSFFGYDPFWFHAGSLIWHLANMLLVWICILKLLDLKGNIPKQDRHPIAFLTTLFFAVHPMNVEAVAWISAVKVLIYAFFYFAATYTYLLYIEKRRLRYYVYTLLLFVGSFLGKEQAVTFPVWLLLICWILGYKPDDRKAWIRLIPFFALSLLFGVITMQVAGTAGKESYPLWQRIILACYSFCEYVFKYMFPYKLSYLYPFPLLPGEAMPEWLLIYPLLLAIIGYAFRRYLYDRIILTGIFFFTAHIAITLHIIPLSRFAVVADRYIYIACIGIAFILSLLFCRYFRLFKGWKKTGITALLACYLIFLGIYTHTRCRIWFDTDTVKKELREKVNQREEKQ